MVSMQIQGWSSIYNKLISRPSMNVEQWSNKLFQIRRFKFRQKGLVKDATDARFVL